MTRFAKTCLYALNVFLRYGRFRRDSRFFFNFFFFVDIGLLMSLTPPGEVMKTNFKYFRRYWPINIDTF